MFFGKKIHLKKLTDPFQFLLYFASSFGRWLILRGFLFSPLVGFGHASIVVVVLLFMLGSDAAPLLVLLLAIRIAGHLLVCWRFLCLFWQCL